MLANSATDHVAKKSCSRDVPEFACEESSGGLKYGYMERAGRSRRPDACRVSHLAQAILRLSLLPLMICLQFCFAAVARAYDTSPPPILQYFESTYNTISSRMPDIFQAGYGIVYTPPPARADSGNSSVGYDPYNRFDLGSPGNPTLYGTQTGLQTLVNNTHAAGMSLYVDLVLGHDGFSDLSSVDSSGHSFYNAGGYPGFNISLPNAVDGDFYSPYETSQQTARLSGLIEINPTTNFQQIRSPVNPNDPRNIRAGTTPAFGRIANVPTASNAQYYPDTSLQPISVYDPTTGEQNIKIYPFNLQNPLDGTPATENALGYLMRNTQWLVQVIGVDGFRIDAAKNMQQFVMNYYDRSVYRQSNRYLLNGQQEQIFAFSEVYDGSISYLDSFVNKTINPNNAGTIGGNRDVLNFPAFFAMQQDLSGNGLQNSWQDLLSQDKLDPGFHGTTGVRFVSSADNGPPFLGNVAYAYSLMLPGNAIVYFNAHQFGSEAQRNFPQDGRGDALGGMYGTAITTLVQIRNVYGQGNYTQRLLEKESYAFERQGASITLLSNRLDAGYDSRTLQTTFAPGTYLEELTGNAASTFANPIRSNNSRDIPQILQVNGDGTVNVRFLRNSTFDNSNNSYYTGDGYLIYGLPAPKGQLSLSNLAFTIHGVTPTQTGNLQTDGYNNATTLLSNIDVIRGNTFSITLSTQARMLLGTIHDHNADGDNALFKVDGGVALNGHSTVDFTDPNSSVYGFEQFTTTNSPGYFSSNGNGSYVQNIDTTKLSDGYHYLDVRVFRHNADTTAPPIYTDYKDTIYVDLHKPDSAINSFAPLVAGVNQNRQLIVKSVDGTANSVHAYLDLPAATTDAAILNMVNQGQGSAGQIDTNLFAAGFNGIQSGNHVVTIVSYRVTGNYNIQRIPGQYFSTAIGAGLGDLNFDGQITSADIANTPGCFEQILYSKNTQFNSAADINGDGKINTYDLLALGQLLEADGVSQDVMNTYDGVLLRRFDFGHFGVVDNRDYQLLQQNLGTQSWMYNLTDSGTVSNQDLAVFLSVYPNAGGGGGAAVPEPSTAVLALLGAIGAAMILRRRSCCRDC
jgi:alpha-amylase